MPMASQSTVRLSIKQAHLVMLDAALGPRAARRAGATLLDVPKTAWPDPRLASVSMLVRDRLRILVVLLLRRHRDWPCTTSDTAAGGWSNDYVRNCAREGAGKLACLPGARHL